MLVFVDESWQTVSGQKVAALGAVAIPARKYNQFCRRVFKSKSVLFGANELSDKEVKSTEAFGRGAFKSLGSGVKPDRLRAAEELFTALEKSEARAFALWTTRTEHVSLKTKASTELGRPYVELVHDLHALAESYRSPRMLALHFDQSGYREDMAAACALQNFIVRHRAGHYARHILQVPNFVSSAVSPGLQAADMVAYLAAQSHDRSHRPELYDWFVRLDTLAYRRGPRKRLCVRSVY